MATLRSRLGASSSWCSSGSGNDSTGWGLHESGQGVEWKMVKDYSDGSFSSESLTFCYARPG